MDCVQILNILVSKQVIFVKFENTVVKNEFILLYLHEHTEHL